MRVTGIQVWILPSMKDPEYERDTGIVLGEGGYL